MARPVVFSFFYGIAGPSGMWDQRRKYLQTALRHLFEAAHAIVELPGRYTIAEALSTSTTSCNPSHRPKEGI